MRRLLIGGAIAAFAVAGLAGPAEAKPKYVEAQSPYSKGDAAFYHKGDALVVSDEGNRFATRMVWRVRAANRHGSLSAWADPNEASERNVVFKPGLPEGKIIRFKACKVNNDNKNVRCSRVKRAVI